MKRETLQKRIIALHLTRSKATSVVNELAGIGTSGMIFDKLIRPCYVQGKGRYIHNCDHTAAITSLLTALKIKFKVGNDAKLGGLAGNYINIKTKIID